MNGLLTQVNGNALAQAINTVVGPDKGALITQLYAIIDQAMKAGYDLGVVDGAKEQEEAFDDAFDRGYALAEFEGKAKAEMQFDEGYVLGVDHARRMPRVADENVQDIINAAAASAYDDEAVQDEA
ncbi:hypothetical protein [Bradyrhizobium sp. BR 10289]|uniref:hypothetical protein n=1 Tax=Bradyrhizobium sp. BR 10289 TaxID=2749993 RepID=UPI001C653133|nr:hypothetical protein [Bradyrhizobium sp. BR 10289]MBW7970977.1 hypothetical protein [Bradyrhizobium sp. BR 10289]